MTPESLQSTLVALRNAGSVFGVLLIRGGETIFNDLAYTPGRTSEVIETLGDINSYFRQEKRNPEFLSFSFDGGNLALLLRDGYTLAVLHHNADEADFLLKAGAAFLTDFLVSRAAGEFDTGQQKGLRSQISSAGKVVDPTTPITPTLPS